MRLLTLLTLLAAPAVLCLDNITDEIPPQEEPDNTEVDDKFTVPVNQSNASQDRAEDKDVLSLLQANPAQFLVLQFSATVIVTNLQDLREYSVSELHSVDKEMTRLEVEDPHSNATSTCSYHSKGGFGHSTMGVRCRTSRNFPEECFCWDRECGHPYLPIHKLFMKLKSQGEAFQQIYPGSRQDTSKLKYSVLLFQPEKLDPVSGRATARTPLKMKDNSVFAFPRTTIHPPQTFPDFPNQFSVNIETIDNNNRVTYSQHFYNLRQKLVSMKFSPRAQSSSPSIFLTSLSQHFLPQSYNIIHDFTTGLQYSVSQRTGNCSIQPISPAFADAARLEGRTVRLKLAYELLDVNPHKFVFSGKREIRGIPADVWTAEKLPENPDDPYSTIEIFFADPEYTVQIEEVNEIKNVPLGMVTHHASSITAATFHTKVVNHYYHFSSSPPHWKVYDISSCVAYTDRLYLKLNLQVSYSQLIQFSLLAAQDSIQAAIASEAHVSTLRVVDIFLSSASQAAGVDVWFVLLQKPKLDSGQATPLGASKEPDLDNSFDRLLATFESNYQVSLHFGEQRRMLVTVREGSLEQVSEAVHPAARSHSYLSLRATYTVGSMAGLGFSMAVVGLSIGIFVGFILWKGRLGLPYYYCSTRTPILRSPMADLTDISDPYPVHEAYPGPPPAPVQAVPERY